MALPQHNGADALARTVDGLSPPYRISQSGPGHEIWGCLRPLGQCLSRCLPPCKLGFMRLFEAPDYALGFRRNLGVFPSIDAADAL